MLTNGYVSGWFLCPVSRQIFRNIKRILLRSWKKKKTFCLIYLFSQEVYRQDFDLILLTLFSNVLNPGYSVHVSLYWFPRTECCNWTTS